MTLNKRGSRKAFSLLETIVALAVMAIISVVIIPRALSQSSGAGDSQAKTSLTALVELQSTAYSMDGAFTGNPDRLMKLDIERDYVESSANSDGPNVTSVSATGSTITGAVLTEEGTCWYLLKRFETSNQDEQVWAFKDDSTDCKAEDALNLTVSESRPTGANASQPLNLSS